MSSKEEVLRVNNVENDNVKKIVRRRAIRSYASPVTRRDSGDFLFDKKDGDGVFAESVSELTEKDIMKDGENTKKKSSDIVGTIIEKLVLFAAILVFIYCAVRLVIIFTEQTEGDRYYDELLEEYAIDLGVNSKSKGSSMMLPMKQSEAFVAGVSQPDSGIVIEEEVYNEEVEMMKAKLSALQHKYPDVYAHIIIEDTNINYTIVRGDDNDFYLNHAITGEPLSIGSVFADYRLKDYLLDNYNSVFYAHNSSTGKMFAEVMKFDWSEEFFNTHNIYIYTPTGLYVFEPFNLTMFTSDYQYFRTRFSDGEDFVRFANEMQSQSKYSKRMTFTEDDRIITLSTCTKTGIKNLRYCLQAKLVEVIE